MDFTTLLPFWSVFFFSWKWGHLCPMDMFFHFFFFFCQVKHIHSIVLLELVIYVIHIFNFSCQSFLIVLSCCLVEHAKLLDTPQTKWQHSNLASIINIVTFAGRLEKVWNIFLHCRHWEFWKVFSFRLLLLCTCMSRF